MAPEDKTLTGARKHFEKEHILTILAETNGNVTQAAKILGVDRANLYRKMERLGISKERNQMERKLEY